MNLIEAKKYGEMIMESNNLFDWNFEFDRAKKRFGCCNYTKKIISISKYLTFLNPEKIVKNTILHEVAHALAGHKAGHGVLWKTILISMGGEPNRCYGKEVIIPQLKYTATCNSCFFSLQRKVKSLIACKTCCKKYNNGNFSKFFLFDFKKNT
jgi:predicted SprT family Zn-dependent metalloprotease